MLTKLKNLKGYLILSYLLSLFPILNTVSCRCDNGEMGGSGGLTMEVNPRNLMGDATKTTISFQLAQPDKMADLEKFKLKVSLEKQEGGIASHLHYADAENEIKKAKEIIETLTHFTKSASLDDYRTSFQVDLKLVPDMETTELKYRLELFSEQGELVDGTDLSWNAYKELRFTQETPNKIQGDNKDIKLKLYNPNANSISAGQLKLVINRTEGSQATIEGAAPTADEGKYEIVLASIAGNQELEKTLTINAKKDLKASFTIQLYYQEKAQGNPVTVSWEQGMLLNLGIERKKGNSRVLTCNIENNGTVSAKGIKLQYVGKTEGVKLQGKTLIKDKVEKKDLGDIAVGAKGIHTELKELDFGTNSSVDIEFTLVYEGGQTTPKLYTFTPLNVDLRIDKLHYDPTEGYIIYTIRNNGNDVAEKVKIKYTNIGEDNEGKEVTLKEIKEKKEVVTQEVTIAPNTSTEERRLLVDFKKADKATFEFGVLYNGKPINQATEIKTLEAKEVAMKLVSKDTATGNILLTGSNRMLNFTIEAPTGRHSDNIDLKHVWIDIKSNSNSFLSKSPVSKHKLDTLTSVNIGKIGNTISLYVKPEEAKEAQFDLFLYYKKTQQGMPLHIDWQEDQLEIKNLHSLVLVGNNEASFTLSNAVGPVNPKEFIIELSSDKDTQFSLIELNEKLPRSPSLEAINKICKYATSNNRPIRRLDTLIGDDEVAKNTPTAPIRFKLNKAIDRIDEDKVTVTVKRGDIELAKQSVVWKAEGVSLQVTEQKNTRLEDNAKLEIPIKNVGRAVPMDEIRIEIIHGKGVCYKLGNVSEDNINTTLDKVLGKSGSSKLKQKDKVMTLNMEGKLSQEQYTANLTLKIYHKNDPEHIYIKEFTWINKQLFEQTLKRLEQEVNSLRVAFNKIDKNTYLSLQYDDSLRVNYAEWGKKAQELTVYKHKATRIQEKAANLIGRLDPKIQTEERDKVETKIIEVAEKIKTDVDEYISSESQKVLEHDVTAILGKVKDDLHKFTVQKSKFEQIVMGDIKVDEAIAEDATQFLKNVVSIGNSKIIEQVSEGLLNNISNLISNDKESIKEQIVQVRYKCQDITQQFEVFQNNAIKVVSAIAGKFKDTIKKLIEEVELDSERLGIVSVEISEYFGDEQTSFLKSIDDKVRRNKVILNIENLFSKPEEKTKEVSSKVAILGELVNQINLQPHISSNEFDNPEEEISKHIQQMYKSIRTLDSMSEKTAEAILVKAEQALQMMNQEIQTTEYALKDMQEIIQAAEQICFLIGRSYRVNDKKHIQGRALEAANNFVDIMNQLNEKKQVHK
ncbi:hypothetical protein Aasi_1346 [Candidatus Amoebophilus asiaticus 5a2]|uniref:Uncharacterized protein n=1 Tax=Amoebophilus asiaticus (strain 5a2) TaxID=452471 RepID=B3ETV1_AMOA5|nr:hypothetical protein [Candidatus Amoebophilus asiaticus]ACE06653.1 hypothetical protein Aasi_1346 [Candidatus Amoebophilus asiaticus 5a2]